jgi:hypothetical protein
LKQLNLFIKFPISPGCYPGLLYFPPSGNSLLMWAWRRQAPTSGRYIVIYLKSLLRFSMFRIANHISHIAYRASRISHRISHISNHTSHITYLISHIPHPISHITYRLLRIPNLASRIPYPRSKRFPQEIASGLDHPRFNQHLESSIQHPVSSIQHPASSIQYLWNLDQISLD